MAEINQQRRDNQYCRTYEPAQFTAMFVSDNARRHFGQELNNTESTKENTDLHRRNSLACKAVPNRPCKIKHPEEPAGQVQLCDAIKALITFNEFFEGHKKPPPLFWFLLLHTRPMLCISGDHISLSQLVFSIAPQRISG